MTTLTDDIRSAAIAAKASCDVAISKANAIDALPPSGGYAPLVWPTAVNCVAGTPHALLDLTNDATPGGWMPEPYATRIKDNLPDGSIIMVGDSVQQCTPAALVSPFAINMGQGGLTLRRLHNFLVSYASVYPMLTRAGGLDIQCGVNERPCYSQSDGVQMVLLMYSFLKPFLTGRVVISHLLPCNESITGQTGYNSWVSAVNAGLANAMSGCAAQLEFAPVNPDLLDSSGNLKAIYAMPDGQHPNRAGGALNAIPKYQAWQRLGIQ